MSTPDGGFRAAPQLDLTAGNARRAAGHQPMLNVWYLDGLAGRPMADLGRMRSFRSDQRNRASVVSSHLDSRWRAPSKLLFQLEPHGTGGPKFPVRVTNRAILPVLWHIPGRAPIA
jgi:hypothetical protein